MSQELQTIIDLIRYGASRFNAAPAEVDLPRRSRGRPRATSDQ